MTCKRCGKELTTQEMAAYYSYCEDCFAGDHPATHFNVLRDLKIKTHRERVIKKDVSRQS